MRDTTVVVVDTDMCCYHTRDQNKIELTRAQVEKALKDLNEPETLPAGTKVKSKSTGRTAIVLGHDVILANDFSGRPLAVAVRILVIEGHGAGATTLGYATWEEFYTIWEKI